jgi:hypothetical protein
MSVADLNHYYRFGDVYEALEACQLLEFRMATLRRQRLIDDQIWRHSTHLLGYLEASIEEDRSTGFQALREEHIA